MLDQEKQEHVSTRNPS